jgi:hypothetical protein
MSTSIAIVLLSQSLAVLKNDVGEVSTNAGRERPAMFGEWTGLDVDQAGRAFEHVADLSLPWNMGLAVAVDDSVWLEASEAETLSS